MSFASIAKIKTAKTKIARLKTPSLLLALLLTAFAGCARSHVIQVTVTNTSTEKLSTIVIDYPEATFGINSLEPGKSFQYRIKPTATGTLKIEFLNARGIDHVSSGPVVHKNDEGSMEIKLMQDGVVSEMKNR
ncbi:MAG TPA: hypothetical protein VKY85_24525 [Candidatus Angelobacter sp.]|nr:hypothetical protein [Candidatus Angelobacter sp.]